MPAGRRGTGRRRPRPGAHVGAGRRHRATHHILITTDDQRLSDLSVMPQTRRLLAQAGVRFRTGLSPHPVCCPARAEILTGQYAQNKGVRSTGGINGGFPALRSPHNTIGPWLQDAGYRTGLVGKFLLRWYDGFEELYDRKRDPAELANSADDPAYLPVLLTLRQTTSTLQWCRGPRACNPSVVVPPVGG